jgi:hypothetical protein
MGCVTHLSYGNTNAPRKPNQTSRRSPCLSDRFEYVSLANVERRCFWADDPGECKRPGFVPVREADATLLEPAAALLIELRAAPTLQILNESAPNVTIFGNGNRLWFVFQAADAALQGFTIVAERVELGIIGGRPGWPVDSLTTDFFSVASTTVTFAVGTRLALAGAAPAPAQKGRPTFALAGGAVLAVGGADALPQIRTAGPRSLTLSNGLMVFAFVDFPVPFELQFAGEAAIASDYASSSDVNIRFPNGGRLTATNGWAGQTIPGVGGVVSLALARPAAFRYFDGARLAVSAATLANMEFANIERAEVSVAGAGDITEFEFRSGELVVRGVRAVDRARFVGRLSFVLDRLGFNFRADYGGGIPPNIVLNLSGADLTFAKEFSGVEAENRIAIVGCDAIVWYEGGSVPKVIDVSGINVSVRAVERGGLSATIATIAAIAVSGVVVVFAVWLIMRKSKARLAEYDKFPDREWSDGKEWRVSTSMVDL